MMSSFFSSFLVPRPEGLGHRHDAVEHRSLGEVEAEEELQERPYLLVRVAEELQ